jgi:hypothetical protein
VFESGIGGGFGFPVVVFPLVADVDEIVMLVDVIAGASVDFSLASSLAISLSPPGRVTMVALASFSACSLVIFAYSIALDSFAIFSLVSVTTIVSAPSISAHAWVCLSNYFIAILT